MDKYHIRRNRNWNDDETKALLHSWKNKITMSALLKRGWDKDPLYFSIWNDLKTGGFKRSTREIKFKMASLLRYYRRLKLFGSVYGLTSFKWSNDVEELLTLENNIRREIQASETKKVEAMDLMYEQYLKGNVSPVRYIREIENNSGSDMISYTAITPAESKAPSISQTIQESLPQSPSSNFKTTGNILQKFCTEFQKSNQQLEENDAAILRLFKEQNEIFRTQTTLLMKLLSK